FGEQRRINRDRVDAAVSVETRRDFGVPAVAAEEIAAGLALAGERVATVRHRDNPKAREVYYRDDRQDAEPERRFLPGQFGLEAHGATDCRDGKAGWLTR